MRAVTEQDFRAPEFREDGALVRKDRWKVAVLEIHKLLNPDELDFEIPDLICQVQNLVADAKDEEVCWVRASKDTPPPKGFFTRVRLIDGSELVGAFYNHTKKCWQWGGGPVPCAVSAWRQAPKEYVPCQS